jgi:hypothetical protein
LMAVTQPVTLNCGIQNHKVADEAHLGWSAGVKIDLRGTLASPQLQPVQLPKYLGASSKLLALLAAAVAVARGRGRGMGVEHGK